MKIEDNQRERAESLRGMPSTESVVVRGWAHNLLEWLSMKMLVGFTEGA